MHSTRNSAAALGQREVARDTRAHAAAQLRPTQTCAVYGISAASTLVRRQGLALPPQAQPGTRQRRQQRARALQATSLP